MGTGTLKFGITRSKSLPWSGRWEAGRTNVLAPPDMILLQLLYLVTIPTTRPPPLHEHSCGYESRRAS